MRPSSPEPFDRHDFQCSGGRPARQNNRRATRAAPLICVAARGPRAGSIAPDLRRISGAAASARRRPVTTPRPCGRPHRPQTQRHARSHPGHSIASANPATSADNRSACTDTRSRNSRASTAFWTMRLATSLMIPSRTDGEGPWRGSCDCRMIDCSVPMRISRSVGNRHSDARLHCPFLHHDVTASPANFRESVRLQQRAELRAGEDAQSSQLVPPELRRRLQNASGQRFRRVMPSPETTRRLLAGSPRPFPQSRPDLPRRVPDRARRIHRFPDKSSQ